MKRYQHILIGTGQATSTILPPIVKSGESIAVIEGGAVGGTCVNNGCTPTKTLVASARVAQQIRRERMRMYLKTSARYWRPKAFEF